MREAELCKVRNPNWKPKRTEASRNLFIFHTHAILTKGLVIASGKCLITPLG